MSGQHDTDYKPQAILNRIFDSVRNAIAVKIVDANGDQITTFGSSTVDTELPAAAALADATANPTTTTVGNANLGFNGTTWDRIRTGIYTSASTLLGVLQTLILAQYNASAPTITDGNYTRLQTDVNANLKGTLGTLIAGENLTTNRLNVEPIYSYASITTQTTTTVKSGAGTLHSIVIPTPTASATVKIYDNTAGSGTVLLDTITLPATLLSDGPITVGPIDASFATGLTIVTAGATMSLGVYYR